MLLGQLGVEARMPRKTIVPENTVDELSILDEEGRADAELDPKMDRDSLLKVYQAMVKARTLDDRMITMQRQGQMGTFAPGRGQEAAQIGSVYSLRPTDWFAPSYRSFGAQMWRGWAIDQLMMLWDGYFEGFDLPEGINDLPFSIVIGCHVPLATGVAMAQTCQGTDSVVLTNFGDGASSEGDVSESLNFAAVHNAPIVFICENNGYAISLPFEKQTKIKSIAHRAPAFGMPGMRVDGNDILAMVSATKEAIDRARSGGGPTLIEAVTFRMEMHTTADDPTVYRADNEVARWTARDPISRFEKYLLASGVLDASIKTRIASDVDEEIRLGREKFKQRAKPNAQEVFDYMYAADMPPELKAQKNEYLRKLAARLAGKKLTPV